MFVMFDPVLKSFLNKHGISEAEFKSYDRTTQDQLSVHGMCVIWRNVT